MITAANGIDYMYREIGKKTPAPVLLQYPAAPAPRLARHPPFTS
jgi:hypothetical protein